MVEKDIHIVARVAGIPNAGVPGCRPRKLNTRIANPGLAPRGRGLSAFERASSPFSFVEMNVAQNIYDNSDFFAGYSQLSPTGAWTGRCSRMAGDPGHAAGTGRQARGRSGLRVRLGLALDARRGGCFRAGPRSVAEHDRARQGRYLDPAIDYRIADLETPWTCPRRPSTAVYSALAFHYVADFQRLARMIHKALAAGGGLVFTIEHPIFMAAAHPHWIADEDGRKSWAGQRPIRSRVSAEQTGSPRACEVPPDTGHDAEHA